MLKKLLLVTALFTPSIASANEIPLEAQLVQSVFNYLQLGGTHQEGALLAKEIQIAATPKAPPVPPAPTPSETPHHD